ncbi:ribosomal protein S18 [Kwoniella mangroviensis CBS 8507]|uniref:mitochondrial 37S ribosomal protein bS18m n=1 Tax=Kwoniella mangroviensis CBS 8507 TaxID=1296122 RepID=UPI00080CFD89|nr:ribosomal protein S18 [Kwoniella mangroviensis CBS 8507]OCF66526.1 ribosomal protein S18 [Kwoniella mangroviensis CBS 8507]
MVRPPLSIRLLHTSLAHRAPTGAGPSISARDSLASVLSSASADEATRRLFDSMASRVRTEADEKRKSFRAGSYAPPHSLTSSSLYPEPRPYAKAPLLGPSKKIATKIDPFHLSQTSPLDYDLNPHFALQFVNPMGKIKSRAETGLTWKNQRKIGKLVRRSRAMGLISRWSNQPVQGGVATSDGRIIGRY